MVTNMNLFSNQLISAGGNVTKNIILTAIPDTSRLWIDVLASGGNGKIKGEWYIRDDENDTFYHPTGQGDLFTNHTSVTNTSGRDRYAISSPFLAKEVQIKITEVDGTADVYVTSDLIIGWLVIINFLGGSNG